MKRILCILLTMTLLLFGTAQAETLVYGDVDADGTVDAKDALLILQAAVEKADLTQEQQTKADGNGDEAIDAKDALLVLQYAVNIIDRFPVEDLPKPEPEEIRINTANFPDANFRSLIAAYDLDGDKYFSEEEIGQIKSLDLCRYQNREDPSSSYKMEIPLLELTGIEYFTALEELDCSFNELERLDLSKNTALVQLRCQHNLLTQLSLPDSIKEVDCSYNQLTRLEVETLGELTGLDCRFNELEELTVTANTKLCRLYCDGNPIAQLNTSKNTALTLLGVEDTFLTQVDLSQNTALQYVWHSGLDLGDFTPAVKIDSVNFPDPVFRQDAATADTDGNGILSQEELNAVTEFNLNTTTHMGEIVVREGIHDMTGIGFFGRLEHLYLDTNPITEIDLTRNHALSVLNMKYAYLWCLDVTRNPELRVLAVAFNGNLEQLDLSQNPELKTLRCTRTKISVLDLTNNKNLKHLYCYDTWLVELDVSKNLLLSSLHCDNTNIKTLDLTNNKELTYLTCDDSVEVIGWPK